MDDQKPSLVARLGPRLLFFVAAILLFYGIGQGSLGGSDDSIYTTAAIESARSGRLVDVTWMGQPLYEKGPVLFSSIQLSALVNGSVEMQARLPGVIFGLLVLILVYRIGIDLGLSRMGAIFAAGFCLASNLFFFNARRPMTDIPGLAFALIGFRTMLVARKPGQAAMGGVLFGLSSLCKITAPVPFVAAALVTRAIFRGPVGPDEQSDGFIRYDRWMLAGLAGGLAAFLPWHVLMTVLHGQSFIDTYFGYHLFSRMGQSIVGSGGAETYLGWIVHRDPAAGLLAAATTVAAIFAAVRRNRTALTGLTMLVMASIPLVLSDTALPHYLVPVLPGTAILAGFGADRLNALFSGNRIGRLFVPIAAAGFCIVSFVTLNMLDLTDPDYSHDTKTMCEEMLRDGSAARAAGMLDLHDMAVPLYCRSEMKLFGYNPGFVAAVKDIPMLKPVFLRFDEDILVDLADTGRIVICEKHGLETLKLMTKKAGFELSVKNFGGRFACQTTRARQTLED